MIIWLGLCVVILFTRESIATGIQGMWSGFPESGVMVLLILFALLGVYLGSLLDAAIVGNETLDTNLPADQLQARARKVADRLIGEGNHREAIVALETAMLYHPALELAQKHREHLMAARILMRMGKKERARKSFAEAGDFFTAANLSMLVREISDARTWYGRAAEEAKDRMPLVEKAALWDRAGNRSKAAILYEEAGSFRNAAECLEMLGEHEKAKRLGEQGEVVEAYERRKSGGEATTLGDRRLHKGAQAKTAEEQGDLYGAAMMYRELKEWRQAAELFERAEEWLRAGRCFELAGEPGRAAELLTRAGKGVTKAPAPPAPATEHTHSQPAPAQATVPGAPQLALPPAPAGARPPGAAPAAAGTPGGAPAGPVQYAAPPPGPPPMPPDPRQLPQVVFVPLDQMPQGMVPAPSGQSPQAKMAPDQAAQYYLVGGQVDAASAHYRSAGRPREAALLAMSVGNYASAAEVLVDALEERNDSELGLLLAQLLIRLTDYDLAEKLLRARFAQTVNEGNSMLVYQWARLFEDAGALEHAARLYREILDSGATSTDLSSRLQSVEERLRMQAGKTQLLPSSAQTPDERLTAVEQHVERTLGAAHFLQRFLDDTSDPAPVKKPSTAAAPKPAEAAPKPKAPPAKVYPFSPPSLSRDAVPLPRMADSSMPTTEGKTVARDQDRIPAPAPKPVPPVKPRGQISILGAASAPAEKADQTNPFSQERRYEIIRELGAGGMGVVYEARDTVLDRRVALKLLNSFGAGQDQLRQFLLEARAIAKLNHANVIAVYDMGMMDLRHYIAMEYVEGCDLKGLVNDKKRLTIKEALRLFVEIAEGLRAAHEAGILHRDIKPANVLLAKGTQAKIVDFGLAKLPRQEHDETTIFKTAGTPGYMAPEQAGGGTLGPACDIYSLGITLFTMLIGEPPHRLVKLRTTNDILMYQAAGNLPSPRDLRAEIPPALEHLFRYCTALHPEERYQSVDAFLPVAKQWMEVV